MDLTDVLAFLANPLVLLLIAFPILLLVGIYVGVWLTHPRKNRVLQIDPASGRGIDFEVDKEDTINAYCKPVGNTPPQRFIKLQKALNIIRKGPFKIQNYALWIASHGTAYTTKAESENVKVPLRDAIHNILGEDLYNRIPNDEKYGRVRDKIENSEVSVTIEFPISSLTPKDASGQSLPSISSDDYQSNRMETFLNTYAHGVQTMAKKIGSGDMLKIIFILGTGIAIGIVLSLIFGWGGKTVVRETAQFVRGLI